MSNEIKQGDKVRISKDVPELYIMYGEPDWKSVELTVGKIDGDAAEIKYLDENSDEIDYIIIPTKYLIKVNDERKEPMFKVGEKVRISNDPRIGKEFRGCVGTVVYINSTDKRTVDVGGGITPDCFHISHLAPYTDLAAPTIKVGDLVEVSRNIPLGGVTGIVEKIDGDSAYLQISNHISISVPLELLMIVQTREQMEACANGTADSCDIPDANNHDFGAIKIPVEVDIQDGYWEAYSAGLAHDIAVKCVRMDVRSPKEIADYATEIARSVVENLKK